MQVGAVFLINGRVVGLESFGRPDTFVKVFKKLVESYALDAIDWSSEKSSAKGLKSDVTKFLWAASTANLENRPSVGLGTDCRLESNKIVGFALAHEEEILHLSVFARENGRTADRHSSRLQRFSTRRVRRRSS
jgi:hypothetical protein